MQRLEQDRERHTESRDPLEVKSPFCVITRLAEEYFLPGMLSYQVSRTPGMESKYRPPMCSQTHACRLCTDSVCTLPISPSYTCACARARILVAIWQAILQKPCSSVAAHQNSIEQFRSGNKDCVIITSYW